MLLTSKGLSSHVGHSKGAAWQVSRAGKASVPGRAAVRVSISPVTAKITGVASFLRTSRSMRTTCASSEEVSAATQPPAATAALTTPAATPAPAAPTPAAVPASAADPFCSVTVKDPSGATTAVLEKLEPGEILRKTLLDKKVELYQGMWAKSMNCGGAGNCGTCLVEVLDDPNSLMSPRTSAEEKKLKGKPASYRLACQTLLGDVGITGACSIKLGPK